MKKIDTIMQLNDNQTITSLVEIQDSNMDFVVSDLNRPRKKIRSSNLELYRIIVMLLIVAHHYVVNSGLFETIMNSPMTVSSSVMILFGAWGKTGINCFVLITGYFMCKSSFTWQKLLKLYLQITFYTLIIYGIFCITSHEVLSIRNILSKLWPVKSIANGFVSCFLIFYLFIPFLNVFLNNLGKSYHLRLIILLLFSFSLLPSIPGFSLTFNYVGWFIVLYLIGSYIRSYGVNIKVSHSFWGWLTLISIFIASICVLSITYLKHKGYIHSLSPYFLIHDSNKILSLAIAVSSFMYFKDLKIPHSRLINAIGGATFGVLLIHANSDAMRSWLWRETVDCVGNYSDDAIWTSTYAIGCVLVIFIVCAGIDWFRGKFIEPHLMAGVKKLISTIQSEFSHKNT